MYIDSFTIGSDPELFLINEKTGKIISSVGLIPGEKGHPFISEDMPEGFGLETDNILAEFNIPPCTDKQNFVCNMNYMKQWITDFVKKINPDYGIKCSAYEILDEDQLQSEQARLFGCSPDYNVYTEDVNPKPNAESTTGRSAGVHLHFGYPGNNIETSLILIKYFDAYIGVPSILYDSDSRRRSLYGKAGCFRLTPYGFEYRSLSGYFLKNASTIEFLWDGIIRAVNAFNRGKALPSSIEVQNAINNSNVQLAKKLILSYNLM